MITTGEIGDHDAAKRVITMRRFVRSRWGGARSLLADVCPTRTCIVCGKAIQGRAEKKACSGKCRIVACRQRRHGALLLKLAEAEQALARAAAAVEALRVVAAQGPHVTASLAVPGGRS